MRASQFRGFPANSHAENGGCVCDAGYLTNAAGNACVLAEEARPENSSYTSANGQMGCACDEGYQINASQDGCEPVAECPEENPKFVRNGELILCAPVGSSLVFSNGESYCQCPQRGDLE